MDIEKELQELKFNITAVFFDWGNTIMKVFPDQIGPMAEWKKLELVEGAKETLRSLEDKYVLALLTNADDSDHHLVRKVLSKMGISKHFAHIFTPFELIARKPAPQFFNAALSALNVLPEHAVMIGDDYENDIIGAKQAGIWTIWFNPDGKVVESDYPYHDFEISSLSSILTILKSKFK